MLAEAHPGAAARERRCQYPRSAPPRRSRRRRAAPCCVEVVTSAGPRSGSRDRLIVARRSRGGELGTAAARIASWYRVPARRRNGAVSRRRRDRAGLASHPVASVPILAGQAGRSALARVAGARKPRLPAGRPPRASSAPPAAAARAGPRRLGTGDAAPGRPAPRIPALQHPERIRPGGASTTVTWQRDDLRAVPCATTRPSA